MVLGDSPFSVGAILLQFVEISICSTLIGVGVALLLSLLLRHCLFYEEAVHLEIVLTLGAAYGAYATAEALAYSGVLSQGTDSALPTVSTVGSLAATRRRSGRGLGPSQLPSPIQGRGACSGGSISPGGLSPV